MSTPRQGFAALAPIHIGRPQSQYAVSQTANIAPVPKRRPSEHATDSQRPSSPSSPTSAPASIPSDSSASTSSSTGTTNSASPCPASASSSEPASAAAHASAPPAAQPHPFLFHYSDLCTRSCAPAPQRDAQPEAQLQARRGGQQPEQPVEPISEQPQPPTTALWAEAATSAPSASPRSPVLDQREADPARCPAQDSSLPAVAHLAPQAAPPLCSQPVPALDPQLQQQSLLQSPPQSPQGYAPPQQLLLQSPLRSPPPAPAGPGYGRVQVAQAQTASIPPVARPKPPPPAEAPAKTEDKELDMSIINIAYRRITRRHAASRRYDHGSRRQSRRTPDSDGDSDGASPFPRHHGCDHPFQHYQQQHHRQPLSDARAQSPTPLPRSRLVCQQAPPQQQRASSPGMMMMVQEDIDTDLNPAHCLPTPAFGGSEPHLPALETGPALRLASTPAPAPSPAPASADKASPFAAATAAASAAVRGSPVTVHTNSLYGSTEESDDDIDLRRAAVGPSTSSPPSSPSSSAAATGSAASACASAARSPWASQPVVVSPGASRDSSPSRSPRPQSRLGGPQGRSVSQRPAQPAHETAMLLGFDVRRNQAYDGGGRRGTGDSRLPRSSAGTGAAAGPAEAPGPAQPVFMAAPQLLTFAAFAAGAAASVSAAAAAAAAAATTAAAAANTAAAAAATASAAATVAAASSAAACSPPTSPAPMSPPNITVLVQPVIGLAGAALPASLATATATSPPAPCSPASPHAELPDCPSPTAGRQAEGRAGASTSQQPASATHWSAARPAAPLDRCRGVVRSASASADAFRDLLRAGDGAGTAAEGSAPRPLVSCGAAVGGSGSSAGSGSSSSMLSAACQHRTHHNNHHGNHHHHLTLLERAVLCAEGGVSKRRRATSSDGGRRGSSASHAGSGASSASGSVASLASLGSQGSSTGRSRRCSCPICQNRAHGLGLSGILGGDRTTPPPTHPRLTRSSHSVSACMSGAAARLASPPSARCPSRLAREDTLGRWRHAGGGGSCGGHGAAAGAACGSTLAAGGDPLVPPPTPPMAAIGEASGLTPLRLRQRSGTAGGEAPGSGCDRGGAASSACTCASPSAPASPVAATAPAVAGGASALPPWDLVPLAPALCESPGSPVPAVSGAPDATAYDNALFIGCALDALPPSPLAEAESPLESVPSFSPALQHAAVGHVDAPPREGARCRSEPPAGYGHGLDVSPGALPADRLSLSGWTHAAGEVRPSAPRAPAPLPRVATLARGGGGGGAGLAEVRRSAPQLRPPPWLSGCAHNSFRAGAGAGAAHSAAGSASSAAGAGLSAQSSDRSLRRGSVAGAEESAGAGFMRHTAASIAKMRSPLQR